MSLLNFSIAGKNKTATLLETKARHFAIFVDEPEALGGQDSAPNPVEYILAGYAGCLNVVFHLVAKELEIKINKLQLDISGDIHPGKFLGISQEERAGFISLQVNIDIDSDAPAEKIGQLFSLVKERCPVNDNLANPTPINYSLKTSDKLAFETRLY